MRTTNLTCLIILILILTGCSSAIKVIDNIDKGPIGYVEYYYLTKEVKDKNTHIYHKMIQGKDQFKVKISFWNQRKNKKYERVGFRIAQAPGTYSVPFSKENYSYQVKEGMITSVKIVFTANSHGVEQPWGVTHFTKIEIDVSPPEKSVSIAEYMREYGTGGFNYFMYR